MVAPAPHLPPGEAVQGEAVQHEEVVDGARLEGTPQEGAPPVALLVVLTGAGAVLAALALAVLAQDGGELGGERYFVALLSADGPVPWPVALLTQLGSGAVLYPLLAVLATAALRRGEHWRRALLPLGALAAAQALEAVAFVTLVRPSPLGGAPDGSFSSGHAMTALLGWGLVARQLGGRLPLVGAGAIAVTAGLTRVGLGLHWPTDVVAGWLVGVLALLVVEVVQRRSTVPVLSPRVLRLGGSRWAWAVTGAAALVPLVPLVQVSGPERMKDLLVYVGAGSTAGGGADVYDFRTAFDMPFTYPPFAALLSEPLSRVPLGLLQVLWVAATLAALVGVARVAMRPVVARIGLPLTLAALLVSSPVRSHLRFGQVGLFLVLLLAADLLHDHRRQGAGLGLAVAVKLTPAVLLPWLLVTRRTRTLATAVAVAAGTTLLGLLLLWPSAQEYLWRALWDSDRFGPNDVPGNQSVRGMLLRSGLTDTAATALWLLAALALVVVATAGARRLERAGDRLGAVGVLAALSIAVSPISWVHHLVFLALPLAALVAAGRHRLAAAWAVVLTVSLPSLGTAGLRAGGPEPFWALVVDAQGLTAVAAVLLLPRLLGTSAGAVAGGRSDERLALPVT